MEGDPVIVMGMHKSGTTLVAEMVHKGGTSMFSGNHTPDYEGGIKYERPLCQEINRLILGLTGMPYSLDPIWQRKLLPVDPRDKARLREEIGSAAWGFKDPRTTITYPVWSELFPRGPRLYVFRSHEEVMQRYGGKLSFKKKIKKMRGALSAWVNYNERLWENLVSDKKAGRPYALIRYEQLMDQPALITKIEQLTGVKLFDARNWDLRRSRVQDRSKIFPLLTLGLGHRVSRIYQRLGGEALSAPASGASVAAPGPERSVPPKTS